MLDLLLRGGVVVDGTGAPPRRAEVGVRDGRIAYVAPPHAEGGPPPAARIVDVSSRLVTPGFIDIHSHSDHLLLVAPEAESKVTQGVTTEVGGNCGFSPGPLLHPEARARVERALASHNLEPSWRTQAEFMAALEEQAAPLGLNYASLVGHGNLRATAMGYADRPPTSDEVRRMASLLEAELEAGAFGFSSGLIYSPGCYSDTRELAELGAVAARHGAFYATHMRSESAALVEAVDEALAVGRHGGCAVQISHHKACGRSNWGKVEQTLRMVDQARASGVDVHLDQYPYLATSTGLAVTLPRWAHEGGHRAVLARLRDPETRARLVAEVAALGETGYVADGGGWSSMLIAGVDSAQNRWLQGLSVEQIAARLGCTPAEAVVRLLEEEELLVAIVHFVLCEEDVELVLRHPLTMIGSDGNAQPLAGPQARGKPHPRAFGTFPRVLALYVRERRLLTWQEAVFKMTGLPARRLGLEDRGTIRPGAWADLVVLDPQSVTDTATYTEPHQAAAGIERVFVNGVETVAGGKLTGRRGGRVLRQRGG